MTLCCQMSCAVLGGSGSLLCSSFPRFSDSAFSTASKFLYFSCKMEFSVAKGERLWRLTASYTLSIPDLNVDGQRHKFCTSMFLGIHPYIHLHKLSSTSYKDCWSVSFKNLPSSCRRGHSTCGQEVWWVHYQTIQASPAEASASFPQKRWTWQRSVAWV